MVLVEALTGQSRGRQIGEFIRALGEGIEFGLKLLQVCGLLRTPQASLLFEQALDVGIELQTECSRLGCQSRFHVGWQVQSNGHAFPFLHFPPSGLVYRPPTAVSIDTNFR